MQAEAKRFLSALSKKAELKGSEQFSIEELFDIADILELNVPDLTAFLEQLNEAGQPTSSRFFPCKSLCSAFLLFEARLFEAHLASAAISNSSNV